MTRIGVNVLGFSDDTEGNTFVEAAHPITLQIDGDVLIADRAQFAHEPFTDLGVEGAWQLVAADLQACQRGCMATRAGEIVMSAAVLKALGPQAKTLGARELPPLELGGKRPALAICGLLLETRLDFT